MTTPGKILTGGLPAVLIIGILYFSWDRNSPREVPIPSHQENSGTVNTTRTEKTAEPVTGQSEDPGRGGRSASPVKPSSQVLAELASKYSRAKKKYKNIFVSLFSKEVEFGLREVRLLGLIDPVACERAALEYLRGTAQDPDDAEFGVEILGIMTSQGSKSAEAALVGIASASEHPLGGKALEALFRIDERGSYQSLYLKRAAFGDAGAIRMLAVWPDPQSPTLLRQLVTANPGPVDPSCSIRLEAEDTLEKLAIVNGQEYDARISAILSGDDIPHQYWMTWALKMAAVKPPTNLLDLCRKRLDLSESRALLDEQALLEVQAQTPGAANRQFLTAPYAAYTHDHFFDEFLVLYAKCGGMLQDFERARLDNFTGSTDPKGRLQKLLSDSK